MVQLETSDRVNAVLLDYLADIARRLRAGEPDPALDSPNQA